MAKSSVLVSLPQMVDLALNSPEVGAVNFNILHSLLHVLIQQVDLLETKVEFKGNDSERVQKLMDKTSPEQTLNLTEYIVTPGKDQKKVVSRKSRYRKGADRGSKEEVIVEKELRVIDQRKDSKEGPARLPAKMIDSMETVVVVETRDKSSHPAPAHVSVALSRGHFDNLENEIEKLKEDIKELKELPANIDLISAIRSADSSPVLDMFQILTLTKRLDASEEAIAKLASMIEDLAREQITGSLQPPGHVQQSADKKYSDHDLKDIAPGSKASATSFLQTFSNEVNEKVTKLEVRVKVLEDRPVAQPTNQTTPVAGTQAQPTVSVPTQQAPSVPTQQAPSGPAQADKLEGRVAELEEKFREYSEHISVIDNSFNEQVTMLQKHFVDLEKEIGEIIERINAGLPGGDTGTYEQGGRELYSKVMMLQEELEKLAQTSSKLLDDKEDRQGNMDALLEQIELLKTIKANREDLQDALANKADSCAVNKKVSHDQFDAACDELSRSIENAVQKLMQQELLWQQALLDIQNEIESKLDKMELTPLRDFVHNKLKMLQDRLKALAALKQDTEAAGTKSRLLRNVNCISCDKDVVMRKEMDPASNPPAPSLPATKSIGPYLAYELDQLRKQQKCAPNGRNLNHFENAVSGYKSDKNDHMCNRYCGGSHTRTTPQQRVTRVGYFLQQWGMEAIINEGDMRGTDGQMYKTREQLEAQQAKTMPTVDPQFMKSRQSMMVTGDIILERVGTKSEAGDGKSSGKAK